MLGTQYQNLPPRFSKPVNWKKRLRRRRKKILSETWRRRTQRHWNINVLSLSEWFQIPNFTILKSSRYLFTISRQSLSPRISDGQEAKAVQHGDYIRLYWPQSKVNKVHNRILILLENCMIIWQSALQWLLMLLAIIWYILIEHHVLFVKEWIIFTRTRRVVRKCLSEDDFFAYHPLKHDEWHPWISSFDGFKICRKSRRLVRR